MEREQLLKTAGDLEGDMIKFMRDLIAIPGESCKEEQVIKRIEAEMKKVGFDEVTIDKMGNIIGRLGSGKTKIMMDAHIDTVGIGDRNAWKIDPYKGDMKDGIIYGRGATDQRAGMVSMVYAAAIIKKLKLEDDYTLFVTYRHLPGRRLRRPAAASYDPRHKNGRSRLRSNYRTYQSRRLSRPPRQNGNEGRN